MRTPFWKFVIQYQTWTATTTGIDQTSTRPGREQHADDRADAHEQQREQRPEPIVRPTFTAVNTTVRSSVCQKTGSWRTEL